MFSATDFFSARWFTMPPPFKYGVSIRDSVRGYAETVGAEAKGVAFLPDERVDMETHRADT
jgi:hypothetical protein